MDWVEIGIRLLALAGPIAAALLAKRHARLARVVAAFVAAIEDEGHGPTQRALGEHAEARGVEDHPAIQKAAGQ